MTTSKLSRAITFGCAVAIAAVFASSASARAPTDAERASNTYPTYRQGQGGCVQDLGYGRIVEGCD
jgi:hypothetical protein